MATVTQVTPVAAIPKQPTMQELKARIAQLEAEAAAQAAKLAAKNGSGTITIRLNALGTTNPKGEPNKGTVAVYGLGQYPTSLYPSQWERLLTPENVAEILRLCKEPGAARKEAQ